MTRWFSFSRISLSALCTIVALSVAGIAPASAETCEISGTITATFPEDPGFEGLWKYTVEFTWDTGESGLSHTSVFLALGNCECVCDPNIVAFPSPAGTSNGEARDGSDCTVLYNGEYACMGDPAIPQGMNSPAVKFEHSEDPDCEPGKTGTGTVCFYSPFPPAPFNSDPSGIGAKSGSGECVGTLEGTAPMCDCSVPADEGTWGRVKGIYR